LVSLLSGWRNLLGALLLLFSGLAMATTRLISNLLPGFSRKVPPFEISKKTPLRLGIDSAALFVIGVLSLGSAQALAGLAASVTLQLGQPTAIRPSETTVLQITLSNNNTIAAINAVGFSNNLPGTLPNGLKVAGAATYTCLDPANPPAVPGSGTLIAAIGTQAIQLTGGVIPARHAGSSTDGSCTILIPVTAGSSDGTGTAYTYTILSGAVTGNDGTAVANIGDVSQSVNVTAISQPTLSKSFSSSPVYLGGVASTLTITVTNPNPVAIPNFSITDTFPTLGAGGAIIKVAPTPVATSTCTGGTGGGTPATFNPVAGATSVSATGGTVAANGSCTITVAVVANHTNGAYTTGAQTNSINATSDFANDIGIQAADDATASITATSPLNVAKSFSPNNLADGQTGSMTITLSNAGTSNLTVTTFDDSPIDGLGAPVAGRGLIVNTVGTTCGGGAASIIVVSGENRGVNLTGGVIPAGGSCTVTANFTATTQVANTPITYTNTIAAGAVGVTAPGVVSRGRTATILVADTLRVLKSTNASNPRPGNPVRYTVTVQNWTDAPMSDVRILDALENGMTFLTGTINGINYTPSLSGTDCADLTESNSTGAANANFIIGTVPQRTDVSTPGACVVTFYVMTATGAANNSSIVNNIATGTVCTNNGVAPTICNGGTAASGNSAVNTTVLSAAKSFSPAGPLQEGTVTRMTITLSNFSVNPLTTLSISDTLPTAGSVQMQVANPANAVTTCGAGVITAVAGSTSVALNSGTVPARASMGTGAAGTCTLQVDVAGAAGVYTNTATAAALETYANGTTHTVGPVSANADLTYSSILSATKSFSPGTVSSGGRSTVTIRMSNSGTTALPKVRVIDPLPTGMVLATPTNAYTTCDGTTSITGNAGTGAVTLTGATIAPGGNCDFLFDVVATGAANWVNTIPPGNILALDSGGVTNQAPVTGTLNYTAGNTLIVAKATNPSTLTFPGEASRLTITITNGTTAVTGLSLTDYFTIDGTSGTAANGMIVASTPQAATTCPGGTVTTTPGAAQIRVSGASMAGGSSCTVTVNVTSTVVGGITNYIPADAIRTDQGLSNTLQATTSLTTQTNIGVVKQFTPSVLKPNERARLRITFYNAGTQAASSLSVLDTLPTGVTVPAGPNSFTTCTGATISTPTANQVQVSGGNLGAAVGNTAASCYVEIDVTAAAEGVYVNTIPPGALTSRVNGVPTTNAIAATDTLYVKQPLVVHKAIGGFTLDAGNPAGFTTGEAGRAIGASAPLVISLQNPNNTALTQAVFIDNLPTGLTVATTPGAVTTCASGAVIAPASATSIRLTGATIPANGSCTVTVNVLSNVLGTYTNTLAANSVASFEGVKNEAPTSARIIVTGPPELSKQFDPPVIPPNGTSILTIVIENDNQAILTLSSALTDTLPTLPSPMQVANSPTISTTCLDNAGTASASIVNGSNTALAAGHVAVRLPSGSKVPAGGCLINVSVTASSPGQHNNNIPVGALVTNAGTNQQPVNAPLLVSTKGYISGKVFRDNTTPDGVYAPGVDTPLAGVEIQLHTGGTCSGASTFTTSTDVQGNYLFAELNEGTYSVCQPSQPAGTLNSIATAGAIIPIGASTGTPGIASNLTATTSQIVGIVLGKDGVDAGRVSGSINNNFSEVLPVSLSGTVFVDWNNNGIQNASDQGLANVTINLTGADYLNNPVTRTTTTDADGRYSFTGLPPGTYAVNEPTQPTGTANGKTTAGTINSVVTGLPATPTTQNPDTITGIALTTPNTTSINNNFGEIPLGRSVSGRVFLDQNNNGIPDGADTGISGQTIQLTGNDVNNNPVNRQATTATDGSFLFLNVPESSPAGYTLTQPSQPSGTLSGITTAGSTGTTATAPTVTPSMITGINLNGFNQVSTDNLFGEIPAPPAPPPPPATASIPTLSPAALLGFITMLLWLLRSTTRARCAPLRGKRRDG
jgi:uncharacterized repeat protein (TIGR01451 family)